MKKRLIFLARYYATLVLLFTPLRLLFMATNAGRSYGIMDYAEVAYRGLPSDIATAGWAAIIPLLLTGADLFTTIPIRKVMPAYNTAIALLISSLFIADTMLYPLSGCKLDSHILLQYTGTPEKIIGNFTVGCLFTRFALMVAATTLIALLLYKATPEKFDKSRHKTASAFTMAVLSGAMIIAIRGGIHTPADRIGQTGYSNDTFLNHSAVNPIFNILHSL